MSVLMAYTGARMCILAIIWYIYNNLSIIYVWKNKAEKQRIMLENMKIRRVLLVIKLAYTYIHTYIRTLKYICIHTLTYIFIYIHTHIIIVSWKSNDEEIVKGNDYIPFKWYIFHVILEYSNSKNDELVNKSSSPIGVDSKKLIASSIGIDSMKKLKYETLFCFIEITKTNCRSISSYRNY